MTSADDSPLQYRLSAVATGRTRHRLRCTGDIELEYVVAMQGGGHQYVRRRENSIQSRCVGFW